MPEGTAFSSIIPLSKGKHLLLAQVEQEEATGRLQQ
jgi:hypothetical protein